MFSLPAGARGVSSGQGVVLRGELGKGGNKTNMTIQIQPSESLPMNDNAFASQRYEASLPVHRRFRLECVAFAGNLFKAMAFLIVTSAMVLPASGQSKHEAAIGPMIDDSVAGFAYVDLAEVQLDAAFEKLVNLGVIAEAEKPFFAGGKTMIQSRVTAMSEAGADSVYVLLRRVDWGHGGPAIRVSLRPNADIEKLTAMLKGLVAMLPGYDATIVKPGYQSLLVAQNEQQLKWMTDLEVGLANGSQTGRKIDAKAWTELGQGTCGALVFGDPMARRVVKELLPDWQAPFDGLTGELVAEKLKWAGIQFMINSQSQGMKVIVESNDEVTAAIVKKTVEDGLPLLRTLPDFGSDGRSDPEFKSKQGQAKRPNPKTDNSTLGEDEWKAILGALQPKQNGTMVVVAPEALMTDEFAHSMRAGMQRVRQSSVKQTRLGRLRQQALMILNYESAWQKIPQRYSVDDEGKPLLSWRVHVLPFEDDFADLYAKFKLNEPWDSPHNLKLVKEMPNVYCDVDPLSMANNQNGKTIYQVPVHKGAIIASDKTTEFKEITDGTSNTLLVATVAPEHAVIWTKPADWEVDLAKKLDKLWYKGRSAIEVVSCDGSTHSLSPLLTKEFWARYIQKDDGEILSADMWEPVLPKAPDFIKSKK